ncbi:MAG: DUF6491 family protein [Wenzhouxiangella sp.]|jgi:hypothetical protein|nr:DUF6491 family protein [Wenzhouxiangella sp.]
MKILALPVLLLLLVGCAVSPRPEPNVRAAEIYKRHASEESVRTVRFSTIQSWRPVSDEGVLIEFNGNKHYLLSLTGACRRLIPSAASMVLSPNTVTVLDQLDWINVGGRWCRIEDIREVDFDAVQEEVDAINAAFTATVDELAPSSERATNLS